MFCFYVYTQRCLIGQVPCPGPTVGSRHPVVARAPFDAEGLAAGRPRKLAETPATKGNWRTLNKNFRQSSKEWICTAAVALDSTCCHALSSERNNRLNTAYVLACFFMNSEPKPSFIAFWIAGECCNSALLAPTSWAHKPCATISIHFCSSFESMSFVSKSVMVATCTLSGFLLREGHRSAR